LYEGFGLPVLEAMASGAPVASSNAGSLREVAGEAAVLVEPLDVEGWVEALERVLLDDGVSDRLREEGPRRAAEFSWERAARDTVGLYRRVVGRR
jgi:glycosyltransferase involved in cell wall biosynthesis